MKIAVYDGLTDSFVEVELEGDAKAQMENDIAQFAAEKAERENLAAERATAKHALLDRLGMTADEAALLLS
jgi:hypothetical protein